jgi:hypothetical protein
MNTSREYPYEKVEQVPDDKAMADLKEIQSRPKPPFMFGTSAIRIPEQEGSNMSRGQTLRALTSEDAIMRDVFERTAVERRQKYHAADTLCNLVNEYFPGYTCTVDFNAESVSISHPDLAEALGTGGNGSVSQARLEYYVGSRVDDAKYNRDGTHQWYWRASPGFEDGDFCASFYPDDEVVGLACADDIGGCVPAFCVK